MLAIITEYLRDLHQSLKANPKIISELGQEPFESPYHFVGYVQRPEIMVKY
jgi:hypothetical protein